MYMHCLEFLELTCIHPSDSLVWTYSFRNDFGGHALP